MYSMRQFLCLAALLLHLLQLSPAVALVIDQMPPEQPSEFAAVSMQQVHESGAEPMQQEQVISIGTGRGLAQKFEGIGGISGGGATSKLLSAYASAFPDKYKEVLDYLFKPKFGAALQILKVEIGGDSQSTDGTESSHMHTEDDASFGRGYEWSLMKMAKQINSDIRLYGLPWVFPGWIGGPGLDPYFGNSTNLLRYIMTWVKGAQSVHGLSMDFLGIWNERPWNADYIIMLRKALDASGFAATRIVATDSLWDIGFLQTVAVNSDLYNAVDVLGAHYPAASSPPEAKVLNKTMICSEEFSAYNDINGGGCWARILGEPFVMGNLSGAIAWNLLSSYYRGFPYADNSLMSAREPWSGNYQVKSPIWVTAHHTHFTEPGWRYLPVGYGSGILPGNGSYVTYVSPDTSTVTIVIETMDPKDAHCFYSMPQYPIADVQNVTLKFMDKLASISRLKARLSVFQYGNRTARLFQKMPDLLVKNGTLSLTLLRNCILTLTTAEDVGPTDDPWQIVDENSPSNETLFPSIYSENITGLQEGEEPRYLSPQAGVWEVRDVPRAGRAMSQVVTQAPIDTCNPRFPRPAALIGDYSWTDSRVNCSVWLPAWDNATTGVFLALRVSQSGASLVQASGVFAWLLLFEGPGCHGYCPVLLMTRDYNLQDVAHVALLDGLARESWIEMSLQMVKGTVSVYVNHAPVYNSSTGWSSLSSGWPGVGTAGFGAALFKDLTVERFGD